MCIVELEVAVFCAEGEESAVGVVIHVAPVALQFAANGVLLCVEVTVDAVAAFQCAGDFVGQRKHLYGRIDGWFGDDLIMGAVAVVVGDGSFHKYLVQLVLVPDLGMVGEGSERGPNAVEGAVTVEDVGRESVGHGVGRLYL